jgi:uncharacterized protein (DUF1697 family)
MSRYAALLRGVSPMNARMSKVKQCFEAAGFTAVKTLLSSGNVVFNARAASPATLERRIETAMATHLGRTFVTLVRPIEDLQAFLAADPYRGWRLAPGSKRVVTFLRGAAPRLKLPVAMGDARILCVRGHEVFSAYMPGPSGPIFMRLIEKTLGHDLTTRTWETVRRIAASEP